MIERAFKDTIAFLKEEITRLPSGEQVEVLDSNYNGELNCRIVELSEREMIKNFGELYVEAFKVLIRREHGHSFEPVSGDYCDLIFNTGDKREKLEIISVKTRRLRNKKRFLALMVAKKT